MQQIAAGDALGNQAARELARLLVTAQLLLFERG
jgi:hypothetical protein